MTEETKECAMGHCHNQTPSMHKDICNECYNKFQGELGLLMSRVVGKMILRAKDRNKWNVDIDKYDIYRVWSEDNKCPILGTTFTIGGNRGTSPSLDRIDPNKGYTPDNIQIISNLANTMKCNATDKELLKFCTYYLRYHYDKYNEELTNV